MKRILCLSALTLVGLASSALGGGHLACLNLLEGFNCVYCSYANSVGSYVRDIAGRTEQLPL